jgi:hypothetical protein
LERPFTSLASGPTAARATSSAGPMAGGAGSPPVTEWAIPCPLICRVWMADSVSLFHFPLQDMPCERLCQYPRKCCVEHRDRPPVAVPGCWSSYVAARSDTAVRCFERVQSCRRAFGPDGGASSLAGWSGLGVIEQRRTDAGKKLNAHKGLTTKYLPPAGSDTPPVRPKRSMTKPNAAENGPPEACQS